MASPAVFEFRLHPNDVANLKVSSCKVGSSGSCQVSLSGIPERVGPVTFTTSAGVQVVVLNP